MSQRRKLSHRSSRASLSQKNTWQHPKRCYDATFYCLPSGMDNLSLDLVRTAGFFDSTKRCVCQVMQLLTMALCRRDPLPRIVRGAIESLVLTPPPPPPPPPLPPPVEQLQNGELETITVLDIPYTLRHFDFDLQASTANNGDTSAGIPVTLSAVTDGTTASGVAVLAGSFSFSVCEHKSKRGWKAVDLLRVCRLAANLLVAMEFSSMVRHAVENASDNGSCSDRISRRANGNGSCNCRVSCITSRNFTFRSRTSNHRAGGISRRGRSAFVTHTPQSSAFNATPEVSSTSSTQVSSRLPPPSLLKPTASAAAAADCAEDCAGPTISLSAPLMLAVGLDGSNSNRATSQMSQLHAKRQSRATAADIPTEELLCPHHLDRPVGVQDRKFSCAVCASQHFMYRHMQRLAQEKGGLARLEDAICDLEQLQGQWRRSVSWVSGSVKDKRLPDSIRQLIRCIGTEAACDADSSRGVTVNPQIIISTDGHCSAVQCVKKCGSSSFSLSGGRGSGLGGNCRWDSPPAPAAKDAPWQRIGAASAPGNSILSDLKF